MVGPRIYIFGGEANGEFFNDLWCFDLSTRKSIRISMGLWILTWRIPTQSSRSLLGNSWSCPRATL